MLLRILFPAYYRLVTELVNKVLINEPVSILFVSRTTHSAIDGRARG